MERKQWFHGSPSGVPAAYDLANTTPWISLGAELVAQHFSWESLKGSWTVFGSLTHRRPQFQPSHITRESAHGT